MVTRYFCENPSFQKFDITLNPLSHVPKSLQGCPQTSLLFLLLLLCFNSLRLLFLPLFSPHKTHTQLATVGFNKFLGVHFSQWVVQPNSCQQLLLVKTNFQPSCLCPSLWSPHSSCNFSSRTWKALPHPFYKHLYPPPAPPKNLKCFHSSTGSKG